MRPHKESMLINVDLIKTATNLIFSHIQNDLGVSEISVPLDEQYYWDMSLDEKFDLKKFKIPEEQPGFTIGYLKDDVDFIESMLKDAEGDSSEAPSLMFMHICPILMILAKLARG